MVGRNGLKSKLSSLNRFEQLALLGTVLIWVGVVASGTGLAIALGNLRTEQIAYAKAAEVSATATETAAPASTARLYPAGWSTATPAPPASPTPTQVPGDTYATLEVAISASALSLTQNRQDPVPVPNETPLPSLHPPDRLVIPAIELDSPVVPISWTMVEQDGQTSRVWTVVDQVVGWHNTSAYPGSTGNVVLNGHHNIKGEVFRYLVDVEIGDRVIVYAGDQARYYAVAEKQILKEKGEPIEVRRQNAQWINATSDERVTMITCWPYTNNTHRLVVVAKPLPASTLQKLDKLQEP